MNKSIEKIDFFRYVLMHVEGGIYADMDTILQQPNELLHLLNFNIVLGIESTYNRNLISQAVLMSVRNHPIWLKLMIFIKNNYNPIRYPTYNTGPDMLSTFIKFYGKKYNIKYSPHLNNGPIILHTKTGVWRNEQIRKYSKLCLICKKDAFKGLCFKNNWFL